MAIRFKEEDALKSVKGVGEKMADRFANLGIFTVGDLLRHAPIRYDDWSSPQPIARMRPGDDAVFRGTIEKIFGRRMFRRGVSMTEAKVRDKSGSISLIWFNQPYIKYGFSEGDEIVGSGKVSMGKRGFFIINPSYEKIDEKTVFSIIPVYRRTKGLSSKGIWNVVKKVLQSVEPMTEFIPKKVLLSENLPDINMSLKSIHMPNDMTEANGAKRRAAFENLFLIRLGGIIQKKRLMDMKSPVIESDIEFAKKLIESLPFSLTFAQKRSLWEIMQDMGSGHPMSRLLQGDVGSGKTVVAAIAAMEAARQGFQTAIMAPTEILAKQHYLTIRSLFGELEYPIAFISGKETIVFYGDGLESSVKRKTIAEDIRKSKIKIIIGTQALISSSKTAPDFGSLGLVVIDEQHRFGVGQRGHIIKKSGLKNSIPHFLSMSATPIPRTIAISMFGDLSVSKIDELPKERKTVVTRVISPDKREKAYEFIRNEVRKSRQVFIVCPRIGGEEREIVSTSGEIAKQEAKTVEEEYKRLSREVFPDLKIAMLHGKMKSEDKRTVMDDFRSGRSDILVSTSVIEVGIDIPNATIMMVENADRFGLAQLYQFKGRVGRGQYESYCFLFSESASPEAITRLKAVALAKNGFELAEKDLLLRGPGSFLGEEQTGNPDLTMIALKDRSIIEGTRRAAEEVIQNGIGFEEYSPLMAKIEEVQKNFHLE
ncbi:MAG: ATP-dependent DNA helicase RecG [Candidatus Colwellbacteria bacterium]|nr:ATP-dependent DNA helicase RecG [Candidatus Colwellbacteria bacterium]